MIVSVNVDYCVYDYMCNVCMKMCVVVYDCVIVCAYMTAYVCM